MDEKRCCTCHLVKPLQDFNVRRAAPDGRQARCRECNRRWYAANAVEHRQNVSRRNARVVGENKGQLRNYLAAHPCVDCGEADIRVLDFDHEGLLPKTANIGRLLADAVSWAKVLREIDRCLVRCANCHRRVIAERASTWRQLAWTESSSAEQVAALARLQAVLG